MWTNRPSLLDIQRVFGGFEDQPENAALTLPPAVYTSPEIYAAELGAIFEKEWVCLGRVEEIRNPGDYFTVDLIGDPLLVVRGEDQRVRVMSNVCRHKWTEVAEGRGNTRRFVCPYHAWTYGLDGRLIHTQYMDRSEGFDPPSCRLPEIRSEIWHGFIYANLDPDAPPLAERLTELDALIANYHVGEMRLFASGDEVWAANWKLLTENFTEGYHTFQTHRESLEGETPSDLTYWGHSNDHFSLFYSPMDPDAAPPEPHHPSLTETERKTRVIICLYPSHVIAIAPERIYYMALFPLGPGEVRTRWGVGSFGKDISQETRDEVTDFYHVINAEDKARLESIQRAVGARYAARGHRSWLEATNHHFAKYVARKLTAAH